RDMSRFSASDLGFAIAPRLNAAGRLDNMSVGVELLLAEDMPTARALALELDGLNQTRKEIEQGMKLEALEICRKLTALTPPLPTGIVLYQADWHQGVLGILASRLKDQFHRPVIAFAQDQAGVLKGSARSIEGLHIRDALERLHSRHPDIILKFGGHAMAAGLSIQEEKFSDFQRLFNEVVEECLDEKDLQGIVWTDGELASQFMNLDTAELLKQSGPWGQAFPEPVFDGEFKLLQQRLVGERHLKMMVEPQNGGPLLDAIAFNVDTRYYPDLSLKKVKLAYKLDVNEYRGQRNIQLLVDYIEPLAE
ncbi:DHHA1 domain-containing protein, partial [Avibacterium paragallinarum]